MKKILLSVAVIAIIASCKKESTDPHMAGADCGSCHTTEQSQWASSANLHAASAADVLANAEHNTAELLTDDCLKCHSTFDAVAANLRGGILATEGVSCESCHGPGSAYKSPTIMKDLALSQKNGLVIPTKELCLKCHNKENPFFKEFNYDAAHAKIAHKNPAAK